MEMLGTSGYPKGSPEIGFAELTPFRTSLQAAVSANEARGRLAELEARRAAWMADGQSNLAEFMTDSVARMDAIRAGRQIAAEIDAQQAVLQESLESAKPFYQFMGDAALKGI